ncbi:MAG: DUF3536 domain-containing protein, partial [Thermodesulfobacteriota bacterium]|nr:DUF3536 domain-containing protein [Thermodesulfobacteriota bacterium]
ASKERLGFGNALAQIYHHVIMPLAPERDKRLQVAWAVKDFETRFQRFPDGMWLPETAVDTPTLEVLAEAGLAFTILAPRQAGAVADLDSDNWEDVDEAGLDIQQPYKVLLPSGRAMAVFFYHGALSQAIAFERLLENGETFRERLIGAVAPGLTSLATDGETYGHHFKFGEMALAFALDKTALDKESIRLTNYAAYLATNPPVKQIRLIEPSSWSCVHGVERWQSDCGCSAGDHADWNQKWRAPLREGLNHVKERMDAHFFGLGKELFQDPEAALLNYGQILANPETRDAFASKHLKAGLDQKAQSAALKLLGMQQWALASFASCAWFFDDLGRIEPLNAMTFCLRAMELAKETGAEDLEPGFLNILERAVSNGPEGRNGRELFASQVLPRRETPQSLIAQALLTQEAQSRGMDEPAEISWPGVNVRLTLESSPEEGPVSGKAVITQTLDLESIDFVWQWEKSKSDDPFASRFKVVPEKDAASPAKEDLWFSPGELAWNKRQALALAWVRGAEEELWERRQALAKTALHMFLPWTESQETQNLCWMWGCLWPAWAWLWAKGTLREDPREQDLVRFLKEYQTGRPDPATACARVEREIVQSLSPDDPKLQDAVGMVQRAREIGLSFDWWPLQNRLWEIGLDTPKARELAGLLGFQTDAKGDERKDP